MYLPALPVDLEPFASPSFSHMPYLIIEKCPASEANSIFCLSSPAISDSSACYHHVENSVMLLI